MGRGTSIEMSNTCWNLHHLIKGKIRYRPAYKNGEVWCTTCRISFKSMGIKCPCCNFDVRNKPRRGKMKKAIINAMARY